ARVLATLAHLAFDVAARLRLLHLCRRAGAEFECALRRLAPDDVAGWFVARRAMDVCLLGLAARAWSGCRALVAIKTLARVERYGVGAWSARAADISLRLSDVDFLPRGDGR